MDVVQEETEMVDVTVDEATDRARWMQMIRCGHP